MPRKKAGKLHQFCQISGQRDPPEPKLQPLSPLPPTQAPVNSSNEDQLQALEPNDDLMLISGTGTSNEQLCIHRRRSKP